MRTTTRIIALLAAVLFGGAATLAGSAWAANSAPNQQPPPATTNAFAGGNTEDRFVAMTPCRIIDTRKGFGKLQVGNNTSFLVAGAGPEFAAQGGKPNGCGIPTTATAIEVTMTAIDAGSGFLRAWPASSGQPNATFMNYTSAFNVSNTGTVAICTTCGFLDELRVRAFGSPTDLVADVGGYYVPALAAAVAGDGTLEEGSRVVKSTRLSLGQYEVTFDRSILGCAVSATTRVSAGGPAVVRATPRGVPNDVAFINIQDPTGPNADAPFSVEVVC